MSKLASADAPLSLRSASRTHAGHVRGVNQDRFIDLPEDGFWVVADGMGGHRSGDVAATRLVEALATVRGHAFGYTRVSEVVRKAEEINAALMSERGLSGGAASGTTLVALLIQEGRFACLWAGDSRAYLLRDDALLPISRDHSRVQELIDAGLVREEGRRSHPQGHVITRAVGAATHLDVERAYGQVRPGDVFLLCSDGLTACLDADRIAQCLRLDTADAAAEALLASALSSDAPDNITLIVAHADAG